AGGGVHGAGQGPRRPPRPRRRALVRLPTQPGGAHQGAPRASKRPEASRLEVLRGSGAFLPVALGGAPASGWVPSALASLGRVHVFPSARALEEHPWSLGATKPRTTPSEKRRERTSEAVAPSSGGAPRRGLLPGLLAPRAARPPEGPEAGPAETASRGPARGGGLPRGRGFPGAGDRDA
ncbi:unnamed protein product, partial [Prorocentrum cordatum]